MWFIPIMQPTITPVYVVCKGSQLPLKSPDLWTHTSPPPSLWTSQKPTYPPWANRSSTLDSMGYYGRIDTGVSENTTMHLTSYTPVGVICAFHTKRVVDIHGNCFAKISWIILVTAMAEMNILELLRVPKCRRVLTRIMWPRGMLNFVWDNSKIQTNSSSTISVSNHFRLATVDYGCKNSVTGWL